MSRTGRVTGFRGTCGACGGSYRVVVMDGVEVTAKHGYTRREGQGELGECVGSRRCPHERSCEVAAELVALCTPPVRDAEKYVAKLAGEVEVLFERETYYPERKYGVRSREVPRAYATAHTPESDRLDRPWYTDKPWNERLAKHRDRAARELAYRTSMLRRYEQLVVTWQLRDLTPDSPEAEKLAAKAKRKDVEPVYEGGFKDLAVGA